MYAMAAAKTSPPIRFNALRQRREELSRQEGQRLTQEDIAARTGDAVSQRTVSHLEAGSIDLGSIAATRLAALTRALKWSLADLQEATGVDLGLQPHVPMDDDDEDEDAYTASARGWKVPKQDPPPIPDALLEAAALYGSIPEFAGIAEYRWQSWMNQSPHKKRPSTPEEWLGFYMNVKDRFNPEEPEE
jgi:transcriptional regulator with XRE-family HTH domain